MFFKRKEKVNKNLNETVKLEEKVLNDSRKKRFFTKKNILIISIVLLIIIIILIVLFKFILKDNVKILVKEEDDKYPILTETIDHNDVKISDYINGYYVVSNDNNNYALMDSQGNLKTDYNYYGFNKYGNLITAFNENEDVFFDKDLNVVIKDATASDYSCASDHFVIRKNDKDLLIDKNGKILLENYDSIICQDNYFIASVGEKEDVYNEKLELILKDVDLIENYIEGDTRYYLNDNFILMKAGEGRKIYFVKSKKFSKQYPYATINDNYVAVTDNNKVILKDENEKIITQFNNKYDNYDIVGKGLLLVPNTKCASEDWLMSYGDLYDSKGNKKTKDGCNQIVRNNNSIIVKDSKNVFTVYNNGKKIFEKQGSEMEGIYPNLYGDFDYSSENSYYVLDEKGNRKIKECKYLSHLDKDLYNCSSTHEVNYVYNESGKIIDGVYSNVLYNLDNFIIVTNSNNKYGLYDKNGNKILDEKYDKITITNSIIILEYNGKTYSKSIKYGNLKEYKDFLKKDNNINEEKEKGTADYSVIKTDEIISKYNLQLKKELINKNEELFKKVAYHVTNNNKLSNSDRKHLLGMFEAIVDFNKYNKIEKLLNKIDKLEVKAFDKRPSEIIPWGVGNYSDDTTSIYILNDHYDYAIEHEMMHMLSYSAKTGENINIYDCKGKIKNYNEVIDMDIKEQSSCEVEYFDNDNRLLEEAGAEYFTTVVYKNEPYKTYETDMRAYILLQYILEDDFVELQYSPSKVNVLYKMLKEKVDYNYEKAYSLINALSDLNKIDYEKVEDNTEKAYLLYHMVDELIDLYMAKNIGDWKENEYLYSIIDTLLNTTPKTDLDKYLRNNPGTKIKYYNDLVNLNHVDYVFGKVKEINPNVYRTNWYYVHNKNDKIVAIAEAPTDPCKFTLELYYNEKGKLIDKKVTISDEPVG